MKVYELVKLFKGIENENGNVSETEIKINKIKNSDVYELSCVFYFNNIESGKNYYFHIGIDSSSCKFIIKKNIDSFKIKTYTLDEINMNNYNTHSILTASILMGGGSIIRDCVELEDFEQVYKNRNKDGSVTLEGI